jgi:hypothetical protein
MTTGTYDKFQKAATQILYHIKYVYYLVKL